MNGEYFAFDEKDRLVLIDKSKMDKDKLEKELGMIVMRLNAIEEQLVMFSKSVQEVRGYIERIRLDVV